MEVPIMGGRGKSELAVHAWRLPKLLERFSWYHIPGWSWDDWLVAETRTGSKDCSAQLLQSPARWSPFCLQGLAPLPKRLIVLLLVQRSAEKRLNDDNIACK